MNLARSEILSLSDAPRLGRIRSLLWADRVRSIAVAPVVIAALVTGWPDLAMTFAYAVLAILAAQAVFARMRGRRMDSGGLVTAAAFALLLPADTPVSHLILGAVFGVVFGELIFGGRGYGFLNPAIVGLAFVHFSTSGAALPPHEISLLWVGMGGAMLLGTGLADWRVTIATLATLVIAGTANAGTVIPLTGLEVFVAVFLFADPAIVPLVRAARWCVGILFGLLALMLTTGAASPGPGALIFAGLLASVFAPLIDAGALTVRNIIAGFRRQK